jgi:hypothetical protein
VSNDDLVFIELVMDTHDAPAAVIHSSSNGAELGLPGGARIGCAW